jgi:hypothetical protein
MSSYFQTSGVKRQDLADITYFNLSFTGIDDGNAGEIYSSQSNQYPVPAYINTNQTDVILENPSEWYASIVRFSVPCLNLPLIQFLIQTPVTDINKGIYSFTLKYQNFTSAQTFVQFEPEVFPPVSIPPVSGTPTQTFTNYYFLYDYTHLIGMLNKTLISATNSLNSIAGTSFTAPFLHYDSKTTLISLYANATQYDGTLTNPVYIYFNSAMANYLQAIPYHTYNYGHPQGLDNLIQVFSGQGLNTQIINTINYIVVSQQYVSLAYMSYLKSIIISTDMNIVAESGFINSITALQNTSFTNILTDFLPDLSVPQAGVTNSIFVYNAPSLYRLFQFKQKEPLQSLSIRVFFTDSLNNVYPLYIDKGQSIELKFMFIKKSLIKDKNLLQFNNI